MRTDGPLNTALARLMTLIREHIISDFEEELVGLSSMPMVKSFVGKSPVTKTPPLLATTPSHVGLKFIFRTTGLAFLPGTM